MPPSGIMSPCRLGLSVAALHRMDRSAQLADRLDLGRHGVFRDKYLHPRPRDLPGKRHALSMVACGRGDQSAAGAPNLRGSGLC